MQLKANDYKANEIIKIIREWTELTRKDFAKTINRSPKTIEAYEYGSINVSLEMFLRICKIYDIEVIIRKKY